MLPIPQGSNRQHARKNLHRRQPRACGLCRQADGVTNDSISTIQGRQSDVARAKRNKPHRPAKVHDRRSQDLLRNAEVAAIEVDDPLALEPG